MVKTKLIVNAIIAGLALLIRPTWSECDFAVSFDATPDALELGATNCNLFVNKKIEVAIRSAKAYAENPTGSFLGDICSKSYFYPKSNYCPNVNRNQANKTVEEIFGLFNKTQAHLESKIFANGRGNAQGSGQGNGLTNNPNCPSRRFLREQDGNAFHTKTTENHHRQLSCQTNCEPFMCHAVECGGYSNCYDCEGCGPNCSRRRLDEVDMVVENERLASELFIRRLTNTPQDDGPCGISYIKDFCEEFTRFASGSEYNIHQVHNIDMIINVKHGTDLYVRYNVGVNSTTLQCDVPGGTVV